jgi:hypothetical protein
MIEAAFAWPCCRLQCTRAEPPQSALRCDTRI